MSEAVKTEGRKPKIAFITADLWLGGGTVFVLNLSAELTRRGFDCHVFTVWDENYLAEDFERVGVPVSCRPSAGTIYEDRTRGVLELLTGYAPDIVISGSESENCEVIRHLPKGIPRVVVFHLALLGTLRAAHNYRKFIDVAVAVSTAVGDALRESLGDDPLPVRVLELGIQSVSLPAPRTFASGTPLRILYLGRLEDPAKRVRIFPRILERLRDSSIPFVWSIAGVGPERAYLEEAMTTSAPDQQVQFLGPVPHGDVPALLAENDVFILTSDSESFCLGLHEAMAAGLVPVASAIPGPVGDIVDETCGISVPIDDPNNYADAIIRLHQDREAMIGMSAAARSKIRNEHSVEAMGDRWVNLLRACETTATKWPTRWKIEQPIATARRFYFSLPARILRRWLARIRYWLSTVSILRKYFGSRDSRGRGSTR